MDLSKIKVQKLPVKFVTLWQRIRKLMMPGRRPDPEQFTEKQLLMAILEMQLKIYDELRIANKDLMVEDSQVK